MRAPSLCPPPTMLGLGSAAKSAVRLKPHSLEPWNLFWLSVGTFNRDYKLSEHGRPLPEESPSMTARINKSHQNRKPGKLIASRPAHDQPNMYGPTEFGTLYSQGALASRGDAPLRVRQQTPHALRWPREKSLKALKQTNRGGERARRRNTRRRRTTAKEDATQRGAHRALLKDGALWRLEKAFRQRDGPTAHQKLETVCLQTLTVRRLSGPTKR